MNNWHHSLGTILAGVAALITAGVGLYQQLCTVHQEIYKPLVVEQKQNTKRQYGIVNDPDGWVNLRELPNIESKVLARILNDTNLEIVEKTGNWYRVSTESGRFGYIFKDRLKVIEIEIEQ